jgi:uncharacterized membrane protein YphA (DoxX/SURF4 family)
VDNFQQKTWIGYLALVRILVGVQYFTLAWPKATGGRFLSGNGQGLADQLLRGAPSDPFALHRAFISGFVVPHAHFFMYLVAFGEVAIAISLITGCLVRVSCSIAAFHNANIYLAVGIAAGGAGAKYNLLLVLLFIVFACASAGRVFGIDGLLHKRFPRSWLF